MSPSLPVVLQKHDRIFPLVCGDFEIDDDIQLVCGSIAEAPLDKSTVATASALETAQAQWTADRLVETDKSQWLTADPEDTETLMGPGWQSNGVEANRPMIQPVCDEMLAQDLIKRPVTPDEVFEQLTSMVARQ